MTALNDYRVLVAVNDPDLALTVRYDMRDVSAAGAIDVANRAARKDYGDGNWQVERVEVYDGRDWQEVAA